MDRKASSGGGVVTWVRTDDTAQISIPQGKRKQLGKGNNVFGNDFNIREQRGKKECMIREQVLNKCFDRSRKCYFPPFLEIMTGSPTDGHDVYF